MIQDDDGMAEAIENGMKEGEAAVADFSLESGADLANRLGEFAIDYGPKVLMAIGLLVIGLWLVKRVMRLIDMAMEKSKIDKDLRPFLTSLLGALLKIILTLVIAGTLGFDTASFAAIIGAAVFALGFALQGSLSNFAAGVMILIFKPYKVGDLIDIEDEIGFVREIQIFNTILQTEDHFMIIIPNAKAIDDKIKNYTTLGYRRVDLNVSMPYEESFPKVKALIEEALRNTPNVRTEPAPFVGIEVNDSHSITLAVRPYADTDHYWDVYFKGYENVKNALHTAGIKVAYSEGVELGNVGP
jgi:small conductance mechanosensitive channel